MKISVKAFFLALALLFSVAQPVYAQEERKPLEFSVGKGDDKLNLRLEPTSKEVLKKYSPANLVKNPHFKKMYEAYLKNLESAKGLTKAGVAKSIRIGGNFIKQIPTEILAFYGAQYVTTLRKLLYPHGAEAPVDDPAAIDSLMHHFKSPSGYVGFIGFMAANRMAQAPLQHLMNWIEKNRGWNQAIPITKFQKAKFTLYNFTKNTLISGLSMSAGMAASSIIEEIWHDQDIWSCSALSKKDKRNKAEEYEMIQKCEKAYERWTASRKLWEWTPHFVSLTVSSVIARFSVNGTIWVTAKSGSFVAQKTGLAAVVIKLLVQGFSLFTSAFGVPGAPGLGLVVKGAKHLGMTLIHLTAFMEVANIWDYYISHPWQKSRYANSMVKSLIELDQSFEQIEKEDWIPSNEKQLGTMCKTASSGFSPILRGFNPFSEDCQFNGPDYLSKLKRASYLMNDFRSYQLTHFMTAAQGWQTYTNEFLGVATASSQIYPEIGRRLAKKENLLSPRNYWNFQEEKLSGANSQNLMKIISRQLKAMEAPAQSLVMKNRDPLGEMIQGILFTESQLKNMKGKTYREKLLYFARRNTISNHSARADEKKTLLNLWQSLLASDTSVKLSDIPLVKLFERRSPHWRKLSSEQAKREYMVTSGLRLLKSVLAGELNDSHPFKLKAKVGKSMFDGLHPQANVLVPNGFTLKKYAVFTPEKLSAMHTAKERNPFLEIFQALGQPFPLKEGDKTLSELGSFLIANQSPESSYGSVKTQHMRDYLLMGMLCGPQLSSLNEQVEDLQGNSLFQASNSWAKSLGKDVSIETRNALKEALNTGDMEKFYQIIHKSNFSNNDYTVTSRLIRDVFGFKSTFQPPRLVEKAPAICDEYAPSFAPGPNQIFFKEEGKSYLGVLDYLQKNIDKQYLITPKAVEKIWTKRALPAFSVHFDHLSQRYQKMVKELFEKPFFSEDKKDGSILSVTYSGKTVHSHRYGTAQHDIIRAKEPVPTGIAAMMKHELKTYMEHLDAITVNFTSKEIYKYSDEDDLKETHLLLIDSVEDSFSTLVDSLLDSSHEDFKKDQEVALQVLHMLIGFHTPKVNPVKNAKYYEKFKKHNFYSLRDSLSEFENSKNTSYQKRAISFLLSRSLDLLLEIEQYRNLTQVMKTKNQKGE